MRERCVHQDIEEFLHIYAPDISRIRTVTVSNPDFRFFKAHLSVIRGSSRCSQSSHSFVVPEITCGIPPRRLPGPEETLPVLQRLATQRVLLAWLLSDPTPLSVLSMSTVLDCKNDEKR